MLQPELIRALKANTDGLVTAALVAMAAAAGVDNAWAGLGLLVVGLTFYHLRRTTAESHERKMAELRLDEQIVKLEDVKLRYHDQLRSRQPELPFEDRPTKPAPTKRQLERDR